MRPRIPRFEPEQIEAEAHRRGDSEKVATTSLKEVHFESTTLSSRYDKADEYETMLDMLEGVDRDLRKKIESIFCDSKAGLCYSVTLGPCTTAEAKKISRQLDVAAMQSAYWHNGIFITGSAGGEIYIAADFDVETE